MEGLFRGSNSLSLDEKGRLTLPKHHRQDIMEICTGELVLTVDPDRCLLLYPYAQWLDVEKNVADLKSIDNRSQIMKRLLIGNASRVVMDKQGRLLIPPTLRKFARLDKQVMLVGLGKKFEIWDEALWESNTDVWIEEIKDKNDLIGDLQSLTF